MRKKLLTTLSLLLMAVSGAWAEDEKYLYLEIDGTSATLKYGAVPDGKPYYNGSWNSNGYSDFDAFKVNTCTTITVDGSEGTTCQNFNGNNLSRLFYEWNNLTTISGLENLNTSEVTNMTGMFSGSSSLTTLNLSGWDTSKVGKMSAIFYNCSKLTSLNLSSWNTSKVEDMSRMFASCSKLTTLDLTGWDTFSVTNMEKMFYYCEKLGIIYADVSWVTSSVTSSNNMFEGCTKLTNWISTYATNKTHAFIGDAGYLTTKVTTDVAGNSDGAGNYWATYFDSSNNLWADANTTVYQAKVNGTKTGVVLTEVASKEIPAGAAVILKSSDSTFKLAQLSSTATPETLTGNELQGTDVALDTPDNAYCLSNETTGSSPRGVGFYLYTPSDGAKIPAHRAYLVVTGGPTTSRGFLGFGDDDDATAIDNGKWKIDNSDGTIYDLSGRIVTGQPRKGIYVKNGKLVVIK